MLILQARLLLKNSLGGWTSSSKFSVKVIGLVLTHCLLLQICVVSLNENTSTLMKKSHSLMN